MSKKRNSKKSIQKGFLSKHQDVTIPRGERRRLRPPKHSAALVLGPRGFKFPTYSQVHFNLHCLREIKLNVHLIAGTSAHYSAPKHIPPAPSTTAVSGQLQQPIAKTINRSTLLTDKASGS